jgi:hypothetical protein
MSKEIESVSIGKDVEPITETQPPLVIDLPEGQKMVVGKLDPDTVIEVATWRGTGRPDSRTNRLMLGVSSNSTRSIESQIQGSPVNQSIEEKPQITNEQIRTGHQYSYANELTIKEHIKQIEAEKNVESKSKWKIVLSFTLALGLIALAFGPLGIRFAHPADGIGTLLGSAKSSVAIVMPINDPKIGTNVITKVSNKDKGLILGSISVASNDDLLISTDKNSYQVKSKDLHGKVIAVLPFIGLVANLFNNG